MGTRATKAVAKPGRGGKKAARAAKGTKKAAKKTAKKVARGTFAQGPNSRNSSNPSKRVVGALERGGKKVAAKKAVKKVVKKAAKKTTRKRA